MERYEGTRFHTRFLDRRPPLASGGAALLAWCRRICAEGLASADETATGNLSLRLPRGFLVTPTHRPFPRMTVEDLVEVAAVDVASGTVTVRGRHEPTSETLLHHAVYAAREDVHAIFHVHCDALLAVAGGLGLPATSRPAPYGTPELARLAAEVARRADVFLLIGHGFVVQGATLDEAGERALGLLDRVKP